MSVKKKKSANERVIRLLTTAADKSSALLKKFHDDSNAPNLSLTLYELIEFYGSVERTISTIQRSKNPRLIILETWLIVDYALHELLIVGLNLQIFEGYRFKPLPFSFEARLKLLFELKQEQTDLPIKPVDRTIKFPMGFLLFCIQHYKNELDTILKIQYDFYEKFPQPKLSEKIKYRTVPDGWLESVQRIDSDWRKAAQRLNEGRNSAAHNLDASILYEKLGFNGTKEKKLKMLKQECNMLLRFLIGVKDKKKK